MEDEPDAADVGCNLLEYLQPLSANGRLENGKTGEVPAGMRKTHGEAFSDWISDDHKNNWYRLCLTFYGGRTWG